MQHSVCWYDRHSPSLPPPLSPLICLSTCLPACLLSVCLSLCFSAELSRMAYIVVREECSTVCWNCQHSVLVDTLPGPPHPPPPPPPFSLPLTQRENTHKAALTLLCRYVLTSGASKHYKRFTVVLSLSLSHPPPPLSLSLSHAACTHTHIYIHISE